MAVELKYRTFDELLAAVSSEFSTFYEEGMIDPQPLIKVAQRINKELSLKIHSIRQTVLDIEKGRVRLPDDFYQLNFALLCVQGAVVSPVIHGKHSEDIVTDGCDSQISTKLTPCGDSVQVVQTFKTQTFTYKHFAPLHLDSSGEVHPECFNINQRDGYRGYIKNGWLYVDIDSAKLYLNYTASMVDENGNLLVLDHDIVNEYYEYALKERILENMLVNGENVAQLYQLMSEKRRKARIEAVNLVGMWDFKDLMKAWEMNRKLQYHKYYRMFETISYV